MHPTNKLRMLAGLSIIASLEKTKKVTEARQVPVRRSELTPKSLKTVEAHVTGVTKAIAHLKNAVKALERIPAHNFMGDIPSIIVNIEEILSVDGGESGLENLLRAYQQELDRFDKPIKESHVDKDKDKMVKDKSGHSWKMLGSDDGEGDDEIYHLECPKTGKKKDMKASEILDEMNAPMMNGPAEGGASGPNFKKGDVIMFDNGVWIIHVTDPEANKVGIIPPSMKDAEETECAKAMQMVDPTKVRMFDSSEKNVLPGPDGIIGTADDIHLEGMDLKKAEVNAASQVKPKATGAIKKFAEKKKKKGKAEVKEAAHHYHKAYPLSHEDDDTNPVNVVAQDDSSWDKSLDSKTVKSEIPTQLDNRGEQSTTDYDEKVNVPSRIKESLKSAISEFESEVKKMEGRSAGGTIQETAVMYAQTAAAFTKLLDYLNTGTVQSIKEAQVFASSLMGPMLHKLPDGVWDFITNGGQRRSLKDYMNKVKEQ